MYGHAGRLLAIWGEGQHWKGQTLSDYESLTKLAEGVVSDIKGDHPHLDTAYDLWVEKMDNVTVGVIDMGDAYQGVYIWDPKTESWEMDTLLGDPQEVIDTILKKRAGDWDGSW